MKENGFSDCIWFYGEDDMWPESIWPKYQSKKAGKQLNEEESKAVIKVKAKHRIYTVLQGIPQKNKYSKPFPNERSNAFPHNLPQSLIYP